MKNTSRAKKKLLSVLGILAAGAMTLSMAACAGGDSDAGSDDSKVVLVADDGTEAHWTILADKLADEGIDLEVRTITDGVQLNQAVQDGEADINLFQHLIFLSDFNVNSGGTLVPVGATAVYPLALYSEEFADADSIPEGTTVAIPNNPTNLARALLNLQSAGLLELKDGGNAFSSEADITSSKVEILAVDTNQTVAALKDGSAKAAVVNNTQAQKGGLGDDLIIFKEDLDNPELAPYINAFVVKDENKDDPRWQKIIDAYHSPEVEEAVTELNQGNLQFKGDWTAEDLQAELTDLEDQLRAGK
ncbi:MetQ/NlpA family ABC transporter substrate-binding protein [Microbacterium aerolatum]|uniref:Putative ABC-type transporter, periplasmic component n=1 Tax=Microbacterium aerolatum TaxID=153731 RepID=A0A511AHU7_9MICO|nr:MetQ/NlpA family ABC transporter substrate-binding protein [Microbacterium aerolatum]GEK86281.1 putative ABC-type transporter, periplasmic component [Microbacterium aerolatum]GGB16702.1 putative ABC-type transporter, periplasmic component [Microbacterium aerolatum]